MVGALVGVLILSAFVPIISATQDNAGDTITYDNPLGGSYTLKDTSNKVVFERLADDTIKLNDVVITKNDGFALISDSISVYVAFGGRWYIVDQETNIFDEGAAGTVPFRITYENGSAIFENLSTSDTKTDTYTWVYVPDDNGEWNTAYFNGRNYYVTSINDVICSGYYSTGDNDTGYMLKNGVLTLDEDYPGSVDYTLTLVDGTSDIYLMSDFKINVGEESFIPWCSLVKTEAVGHQTSGALYEVIGLLPLIAGIGLLLGVCIEVFRRYY